MSNRIGSAKERLLNYPVLLSKCAKEAKLYATCIKNQVEVKHAACEKEFLALLGCLRKAAADSHTKL